MSFNGNGTFQINTTGQPVVDGTLIEADVFNDLTEDIAAGLTNCLTKDGQTTPTANIPMGGQRITGLGLGTSSTDAARVDNANVLNMCEFRLSLTTAVPVTTADVSSQTVYWTPYKGNRIALYDGTNWVMRTSTELSVSVAAVTADRPHDVFVYDSSGTPTLELAAWTNSSTRATALTTQNGVLVKSGAATRRYVGTIGVDGGNTVHDSVFQRYVWNYYNRVRRVMRAVDTTDSWNYTTATWREANNSTSNRMWFVMGWAEDMVSAEVRAMVSNSSAGTMTAGVGIGLDSTTAVASGTLFGLTAFPAANVYAASFAQIKTFPGVGTHYLSWLEYSEATGTTTWYGDNGAATLRQSGITGEIWS